MSHFVIAVLTKTGSEEEVQELMAPYHEFECTGINDQYVQDVNVFYEYYKEYTDQSCMYIVNNTTNERKEWGCKECYRHPTAAEEQEIITEMSSWVSGGVTKSGVVFIRKDFGDGWGYALWVAHVPEGWTKTEIPCRTIMSFADFIDYWYGDTAVEEGVQVDTNGAHKHRYYTYVKQEDGSRQVQKVIRRTNPNAFWDWYVIGGRWDNAILQGNRCKVSEFPELKPSDTTGKRDEWGADYRFFGVITPDGLYHPRGRGGWRGTVHDEKDNWAEVEAELFRSNPDSIAVVVDFHI